MRPQSLFIYLKCLNLRCTKIVLWSKYNLQILIVALNLEHIIYIILLYFITPRLIRLIVGFQTTHCHITNCKLDSVVYAGVCMVIFMWTCLVWAERSTPDKFGCQATDSIPPQVSRKDHSVHLYLY